MAWEGSTADNIVFCVTAAKVLEVLPGAQWSAGNSNSKRLGRFVSGMKILHAMQGWGTAAAKAAKTLGLNLDLPDIPADATTRRQRPRGQHPASRKRPRGLESAGHSDAATGTAAQGAASGSGVAAASRSGAVSDVMVRTRAAGRVLLRAGCRCPHPLCLHRCHPVRAAAWQASAAHLGGGVAGCG